MTDITEVYRLLKAFTQGLSHKVRTPLSVISNEMVYLPGTEELLSPKRCKEIAEILQLSTLPAADDFGEMELSHFFEQLGIEAEANDMKIKASVNMFRKIFKLLKLLLKVDDIKIEVQDKKLILGCLSNMTIAATFDGAVTSFTECFCEKFAADTYMPPLLDVMLSYHAAKTRIAVSDGLTVTIEVPLL